MPDDDWALGQNEVDVRNEARNPLNDMPAPMDKRQTWYFTFGIGDRWFGKSFVRFENATFDEARVAMMERFGNKWAFQYNADDWLREGKNQAERYGLAELVLPE